MLAVTILHKHVTMQTHFLQQAFTVVSSVKDISYVDKSRKILNRLFYALFFIVVQHNNNSLFPFLLQNSDGSSSEAESSSEDSD